jgi:phosphomannomutase
MSNIENKLMISVSGVRGIFGKALTPLKAMEIAAHFGIFHNRGKIIIGRDSRTTGPAMLHAIISGLLSVGCDVVDLGIVSTPTVLLAIEESDANGGIAITASHNPAQWNAMKLVSGNGLFLFPEAADRFIKSLDDEIEYASWENQGKLIQDNGAIDRHINKVMSIPYINFEKIRNKHFKVVIDTVNGAGGLISPKLLQKLGCEVIAINKDANGYFAHTPEPLNKNLTQLEEAVRKNKADVGFANDPDVDRLAIVSEKGKCIGEEFSLLISENYVLKKKKGPIVTNLSSSMASDDLAKKYGVEIHRTKVGEINVGKKMSELKSPIGGEGNGGVICPDVHYTRDAPAGMALILAAMAESDKTVSELADEIPHYYFAKDKMKVDPKEMDGILEKIPEIFKGFEFDTTDGIKIIDPKYWIHVRKSGTEPIIRVYVESETQEKSDKICKETIEKLLN